MGGPVTAVPIIDEKERAARLFAESIRNHEEADRAEQQRQQDIVDRATRHDELRAAKAAAAARLKQLRGGGGSKDVMADADATYRNALASLQEFETGERPHWAPPPRPAERADTDDGEADGRRDANGPTGGEAVG